MTDPDRHEVYFEFVAIGNVVKVTAIDSVTGTEVSAMGPTSASQADLQQLALQKLKARIKRGNAAVISTYCGCARAPSKPWRVSADMVGQTTPGEPHVHVRILRENRRGFAVFSFAGRHRSGSL